MRRALAFYTVIFVSALSAFVLSLGPSAAQTPSAATSAGDPESRVSIIADEIIVEADGHLIAKGHVQIFFKDARLNADQINYYRAQNRLVISSDLTLTDSEGTIITGESADISTDLTRGIIQSARILLNRQLQIAASQVKKDGAFTHTSNVIASSCRLCDSTEVPLWEMRAQRVLHDKEAQRLYYYNAHFRLLGIPVIYTPYISTPDPRQRRAAGFLSPKLRTSSTLGTGVKLPYYIPLTQYSDLTITPYLAQKTRSAEFRIRQKFQHADITLRGALSKDDLMPDQPRYYVALSGNYALPRDFHLTFNGIDVSDSDYLSDYGLSTHKVNEIKVARTRHDIYVQGQILDNTDLRSPAEAARETTGLATLHYHKRGIAPIENILGGESDLIFDLERSQRGASALNFAGEPDGGTFKRAEGYVNWQRSWALDSGVIAALYGGLGASYSGAKTQARHDLAAELRWPLIRKSTSGNADVISPFIQFVPSRINAAEQPRGTQGIYEQLAPEFDSASLLRIAPRPGSTSILPGGVLNLGFHYNHLDADDWTLAITGARAFRKTPRLRFNKSSGLDGKTSDILLNVRATSAPFSGYRLSYETRTLFGPQNTVTRTENRVALKHKIYGITGNYIQIAPDRAFNRGRISLAKTTFSLQQKRFSASATHTFLLNKDLNGAGTPTVELGLQGAFQINSWWTGTAEFFHDIDAKKPIRAKAGLVFANECLRSSLSLSRALEASDNVSEGTVIEFSLDLAGFGGSEASGPGRQCRL